MIVAAYGLAALLLAEIVVWIGPEVVDAFVDEWRISILRIKQWLRR